MAAAKTAPDAGAAQSFGEQVEAWMVQLEQAPAVTPAQLARGLQAAAWRALGAALIADPTKAPAAAAAAVEAAQAAAALLDPDSGDAPVTEAEVVTSLRRAVRRGLGSDDPRRAVEALALWRQERALLDPDGFGAADEAEDAALAAEVEAAAERARAAGLAMVQAGEVGR